MEMNKKFKIAKNSTPLNDQKINGYKDFRSLQQQYETITKRPKKPIYKDPKRWFYILIIGIVLYLLFS